MQRYFNILFLAALIVLAYLSLSEGNTNPSSIESSSENNAENNKNSDKSLIIVYVNTDTIWTNYLRVNEMKDKLIEEKVKSEDRYKREIQKLEKEFKEFQARSRFQSAEKNQMQQQELMMKEQQLMGLEQELTMNLAKSEQEKNDIVTKDIRNACEKIANEQGYDYVLSYSSEVVGEVIFARNAQNITNLVIKELNDKYTLND